MKRSLLILVLLVVTFALNGQSLSEKIYNTYLEESKPFIKELSKTDDFDLSVALYNENLVRLKKIIYDFKQENPNDLKRDVLIKKLEAKIDKEYILKLPMKFYDNVHKKVNK